MSLIGSVSTGRQNSEIIGSANERLAGNRDGSFHPPMLTSFPARTQKLVQGRMEDLAPALARPDNNDRLLFFQALVVQKGFKPGDAADSGRLKGYLLGSLVRVLKEAAGYATVLESARKLGDGSAEFAERSTLFRDRGLSLDTSLAPNFAVEESLKAMRDQKLLEPRCVRAESSPRERRAHAAAGRLPALQQRAAGASDLQNPFGGLSDHRLLRPSGGRRQSRLVSA